MKLHLFVVGALALALASCATAASVVGLTATQLQTKILIQGADTGMTVAAGYLKLPVCAAGVAPAIGICKSKASVAPVIAGINATLAARNTLETALEAAQAQGTGVGVAWAAYDVLQSAKAALSTSVTTPAS